MKQLLSFLTAFCLCFFPTGNHIPDWPFPKLSPTHLLHQSTQSTLTATFLDVGQGDCALIELPDGQTMLIDAGNKKDGPEIISQIKNKGYDHLDYVVATHPHADHIGSMTQVLQEFPVEAMYLPNQSHTSQTFEQMLDTIEENGVPLYPAQAGTLIANQEGYTISLLAPLPGHYSELNNYSAVVKITYGNHSYLFMGDAEEPVEKELLSENIEADVLKVGHHGSSYASSLSFLQAVSPLYGVISCGSGNSYGHPHQETLNRLNQLGIEILRTDLDGTIVISTNGTTLQVSKQASPAKEKAPPFFYFTNREENVA